MKKIKLTQKEEEQIKELVEVQRQSGILQMKIKKMAADFWYDFQTRMGGGSYTLNLEEGEVWQKTFEERQKEKQQTEK